jgi:post-segregation antitoxin (ccd killing protein)
MRGFVGSLPMPTPLFDSRARKQTVSLTMNSDLYARTRALGINASRVADAALAQALREKQAELYQTNRSSFSFQPIS